MNLILFILSLSLLIFIHEFGHFIFAKIFNVYCLEFSIGMGPAIISKKFKKDSETTYSLRCLPIGGYVSMAGENTDNDEEKALDIPYQRTINGINPWKRAIVTVAGVTFNFIFAIILIAIFIFCNGVSTNDNTISVSNNSIASKSGLSSGDKIVAIKDLQIVYNDEVIYQDCIENRCDTAYFNSFYVYLNNASLNNALTEYLDTNPDATPVEEVTVIYTHKGVNTELTTSLVREYSLTDSSFPVLGLSEATKIPNFFQGIALTFKTFGKIIKLMFTAIGNLFTPEGFNSLGGVVSMYKSSETMASKGVLSYIWYIAIISVNLGFFNLLPIPALDGARFYVSIIEGITKKKLNPKIEGYLNLGGLILLFSLMIVVTIKDVVQLF
jgi:regulator of sigma E protease